MISTLFYGKSTQHVWRIDERSGSFERVVLYGLCGVVGTIAHLTIAFITVLRPVGTNDAGSNAQNLKKALSIQRLVGS